MSEMKCPKRRSQRKITFFLSSIETNNKQKIITFFHLHVNQELLLSHSGYIYIELAELGMTLKNDALFSNPDLTNIQPLLYRNIRNSSARLNSLKREHSLEVL